MTTGPPLADLLRPPDLAARVSRTKALGLATREGVAELLQALEELVHTEPATALDLAELCEAIAAPLDCSLTARARYLHARVLTDRGEFDGALELIERARSDWFRAGDPVAALRTDLGRMHVLDDLGRHRDAARVGEALIAELDALDADSDEASWLRAAAWENLGVALGFIGRQYEALDCYQRAEADYQRLGLPDEVARPRANRGIELLHLGRARDGLAALQSAAAIFNSTGDRLWSSKCDGHIAEAHRLLGEPVHALRLLQHAEATVSELGATAESIRLRITIADTYLDLGLYDEALDVATAVAQECGRLGMRHDTGIAAYLAGVACLGRNDPRGAEGHLATAAAVFHDVADTQFAARVRLAQASVSRDSGRLEEATEGAALAATELAAGKWQVPLYWAKLMQADLAPPDLAVRYLDDAQALLELLPVPPLRYPYLIRAARAHRRAGRIEECEQALRSAVDLVEKVSATLPDHLMRTAYRADKTVAYDELIALLADHGDPSSLAEAATVADRAKARTLVDLLDGSVRPRDPGSDVAELGTIRADLNAVYSSLLDNGTTSPELLRHAEELERRAGVLHLGRLPQRPPGQSVPTSIGPRPDHTPTLAYHVIGEQVIAFVSPEGQTRCIHLGDVAAPVSLALQQLSAQWQRFGLGGRLNRLHGDTLTATANDILQSLYRWLVEPLEDVLATVAGTELVIVPHRLLGQVPFHALYDGSAHLVDRWTITIAPTTSALPVRRVAATGETHRGLILAVPDEHTPGVETEAAAVAACLPDAEILVGARATGAALRAGTPGPAYVHIACHGLYRPANPLFSSLRLADGWSTAAQVLDLDLRGALVTLSACESGRSDEERPEPVGLAWAFLAAGASGVIVSQWLVDDAVTQQLMVELYTGLAVGRSPARALRDAQLVTRAANPHPFHWAPFTFVSSLAPASSGREP